MKPRIGVVLSGCGVQDGSEIHEATLTLLALDRADVEVVCMAPDHPQTDVVDHVTGNPTGETRHVLRESARIARGKIRDLAGVSSDEIDGIVLPGGFGAAKNLSTFAKDGAACTVDADLGRLLRSLHAANKPIAALCISPAILAAVFGRDLHPELTIGSDARTARALEEAGAKHRSAGPSEVVVDRANRLVTTPCYMTATRIRDVADGVDGAVKSLLSMVRESTPAGA